MRKFILLSIVLLSVACSSNDEELRTLSTEELLTDNAWVYDRSDVIDIVSSGNLTYQEALDVIPANPYSDQDTYIFDTDGTGTLIVYGSNGSPGTQTFSWVILPNGNLRLFNMGTFNDETTVFELSINSRGLSLTNDRELLYQGTLIKYVATDYFNIQ